MFHSSYKISDVEYQSEEINVIRGIFLGLGYSKHTIDEVLSDVRRNHFSNAFPSPNDDDPKSILLKSFNDTTASVVKPLLRETDLQNFKVGTCLKMNQTTSSIAEDLQGVYSVPFKAYPKTYFGQTGKKNPNARNNMRQTKD